jgi:hypothetical protein
MKGIEAVTAYSTKDGKLFANAEMAVIHAGRLAERVEEAKKELALLAESQRRYKRERKRLSMDEAALMQSISARASKIITEKMDFIKRGGV